MKTLPKYSKAQYEVWDWKRKVASQFLRETKKLPIEDRLLWWNNPELFYKKHPSASGHIE